jgi:hypothetical protein
MFTQSTITAFSTSRPRTKRTNRVLPSSVAGLNDWNLWNDWNGWTTKYRRGALTGEVATRVRDLIREICGQHEVTILKGHVAKDICICMFRYRHR